MAGKKGSATKEPTKVEEVKPAQNRTEKRVVGRPFQPGNCANPGGRPKVPQTVKALAREFTEVSIRRLAAIVNSENATQSAQVQAATALLDRGWGKPLQQLEVGEAGAFNEMSEDEVDRYISDTAARLAMLAPPDEEDRVH